MIAESAFVFELATRLVLGYLDEVALDVSASGSPRALYDAVHWIVRNTLVPTSWHASQVGATTDAVIEWTKRVVAPRVLDDAYVGSIRRGVTRALIGACRSFLEVREAVMCSVADACPYCGGTSSIEPRGENPRGVRHVCLECSDTGGPSVFLTPFPESP